MGKNIVEQSFENKSCVDYCCNDVCKNTNENGEENDNKFIEPVFVTCTNCNFKYNKNELSYCKNCVLVKFDCCKCKRMIRKPFEKICNICYTNYEEPCTDCDIRKKLYVCFICNYNVCEKHLDLLRVIKFKKIEMKKNVEFKLQFKPCEYSVIFCNNKNGLCRMKLAQSLLDGTEFDEFFIFGRKNFIQENFINERQKKNANTLQQHKNY